MEYQITVHQQMPKYKCFSKCYYLCTFWEVRFVAAQEQYTTKYSGSNPNAILPQNILRSNSLGWARNSGMNSPRQKCIIHVPTQTQHTFHSFILMLFYFTWLTIKKTHYKLLSQWCCTLTCNWCHSDVICCNSCCPALTSRLCY